MGAKAPQPPPTDQRPLSPPPPPPKEYSTCIRRDVTLAPGQDVAIRRRMKPGVSYSAAVRAAIDYAEGKRVRKDLRECLNVIALMVATMQRSQHERETSEVSGLATIAGNVRRAGELLDEL